LLIRPKALPLKLPPLRETCWPLNNSSTPAKSKGLDESEPPLSQPSRPTAATLSRDWGGTELGEGERERERELLAGVGLAVVGLAVGGGGGEVIVGGGGGLVEFS